MEIICPECQFGREVDETKIPARSQVATCPKCKTKFKFRELPDEEPPVVEEPVAPVEEPTPAPASIPTPEVEDVAQPEKDDTDTSTFPKLPNTNEGQKGLWDTLDEMAPPQEPQKQAEPEQPATVPEETVVPEYSEPEPTSAEPPHVEEPIAPERPATPEQQPIPGWNGEFSDDFPDPHEVEEEPEPAKDSPMVPPPFEQLDRYGFFRGIIMTIKLVLMSPRLFFSVMPVGGGLSKPLTFTILLAMVQGFSQYFWGMAGLTASTTDQAQSTGALEPLLMLLFMPAVIAAGQFLITGIYHVLLILMRAGDKGFEGTFRALAYANAPIILGIFPMPLLEIEMGWMVIVAYWGLFLTVTGLKFIHQTSYAKVIPVAIVPLLLAMIAGLAMFQSQMVTI